MFSFGNSFYIKNISLEAKIYSSLILSLVITGIDVIDITRYPISSLKYKLASILTVFKKKNIISIKA